MATVAFLTAHAAAAARLVCAMAHKNLRCFRIMTIVSGTIVRSLAALISICNNVAVGVLRQRQRRIVMAKFSGNYARARASRKKI